MRSLLTLRLESGRTRYWRNWHGFRGQFTKGANKLTTSIPERTRGAHSPPEPSDEPTPTDFWVFVDKTDIAEHPSSSCNTQSVPTPVSHGYTSGEQEHLHRGASRRLAGHVAKNEKSRRGRTPVGIRPRRLTRQRAPQSSRVALHLVIRQTSGRSLAHVHYRSRRSFILRFAVRKTRGDDWSWSYDKTQGDIEPRPDAS
jgi:hypothetical protein